MRYYWWSLWNYIGIYWDIILGVIIHIIGVYFRIILVVIMRIYWQYLSDNIESIYRIVLVVFISAAKEGESVMLGSAV